MNGLVFEDAPPVIASAPTRTDIACFVGFVARRQGQTIPASVTRWWREQGWPPGGARATSMLDLPVPIDTWAVFDKLFAWEKRPLDSRGQFGTSYLGAAVRSFFAQGGRKCYVVRVGDPWTLNETSAGRLAGIQAILPGFTLNPSVQSFIRADADRPDDWHGITHLFGLPDVSFLVMPDLCDAFSAERGPINVQEIPSSTNEQFVECATPTVPLEENLPVRKFAAPRCDDQGFEIWARAMRAAVQFISGARTGGSRMLREVQLIAAAPLPSNDSKAASDLLAFLTGSDQVLAGPVDKPGKGSASAFLQLVYPWIRTPGSEGLRKGSRVRMVFSPGCWRQTLSTTGLSLARLILQSLKSMISIRYFAAMNWMFSRPAAGSLVQRVSLIGRTATGFELFSDVTTSTNQVYRNACVNRLVSAILRSARLLGQDVTFENSGERTWRQLRESMETLLEGLWRDGAFRGETASQAFTVRCDQSTMSQNDIDNGRIIARVEFEAAVPIETITLTLSMDEGQLSVQAGS